MKRSLPLFVLAAILIAVLASCSTTYAPQEPYIIRAPGIGEPAKTDTPKTEPMKETPKVEPQKAPEPEPVPVEEPTPTVMEEVPEAKVEETPIVLVPEEEPVAEEPTAVEIPVEEEPTPVVEEVPELQEAVEYFPPVDMEELFPSFNYAYGINAMNQLLDQGIDFIASYFARGVFDACIDRMNPSLMAVTDIQPSVDNYVAEYLYEGKTFEPGERPVSISEVMALPVPEDIPSRFSYAYAFDTVVDLLESEVDILPSEFATGALDALYGVQTLDQNGVQTFINNYIIYLNEEYYKAEATKTENNLEKAMLFLEKNGQREEVRTLSDGIQLEILGEDEYLGSYPREYDIVLIDYNLYALDYDTEDLEIIDADYGLELKLEEADYPMKQSVLNMKVGQAQRSFIPPQIGLADTSSYDVEPNTILVYDIALNGIVE